jgi:hypothetical protein
MASVESSTAARFPPSTIIMVLLLLHVPGIIFLFPRYTFTAGGTPLRVFAVALALLTLLTLAGLWLRKAWAPWATLVVVACKATVDLFGWSFGISPVLTMASLAVLALIVALVFVDAAPPSGMVTPYQRALFGAILAFAAWVAVWGWLLPAEIGSRLPLTVPPLHARFLGAMYLAGSVFMILAMLARTWPEIRVVTIMLAFWTGMLGVVSILNLSALDWSRGPLWFWFVAYLGFPLIAFWVAWCQRSEAAHPNEPEISGLLRLFLALQGIIAVAIALFLLVAPLAMSAMWPWPIAPLVANIYGAPFLAFGLGSLYAARQHAWSEVRIMAIGTLVFALGVLVASLIHANLFDPRTPSAWLWFGGFGISAIALAAFTLWPPLRRRA